MHVTRGETVRPARRRTMQAWRTPRFALGLALVLTATAVGGWAFTDDDERYWALRSEVREGEPVRPDQLVATRARLDGSADEVFLDAETAVANDAVWSHDVPAGALVPRGAWVSTTERAHELPMSVAEGAMPADLRPGDVVDVWVGGGAEAAERPAERVLAGVRVVAADPSTTGATVVVDAGDEPPSAATMGAIGAGHVMVVRRS